MGTLRLSACGVFVVILFSAPALASEPSSTQSGPVLDRPAIELPGGAQVLLTEPAGGSGVYNLLSNVPAYDWYHGCGPTAVASIIGYYDVLGYSNLFDAAGWAEVKLTSNVQDQISSPEHNAKYDPHPDNPILPVPPNTSIACWFQTSVNLEFGWSYLSYSDDAFDGYVTSKGYECTSAYTKYNDSSGWNFLVQEIDAGRPLLFLVDTNGDGSTDHFVPVFGYEDRGEDGKFYACYDTWNEGETVRWERARAMASGRNWGVGYVTWAHLTPEPGTVVLLAFAACLPLVRRRRRAA